MPSSSVPRDPALRNWSIVVLLGAGMIVAYLDRANLSVALAVPEFKELFHLSDQDRGWLNSAFFWTYALLQIPSGMLVDRFGVKIPYAICFLFWSAVSAATALAGLFWQLLMLRLLLGVGEAMVTPGSMRWIRFHIDEKHRGLAISLFLAGTKFGPALGAPVAAYLIQNYGWRQMFAILGLGALIWLIPWWTLVRNDDRQLERDSASSASSRPAIGFGEVLKTPLIWGVIIGTFSYNYFVYFCMTWLPAYFVEHRHLPLDRMGIYTGFSFAGMAVVAILAGAAADWMIARGAPAIKVRKGFTIAGFVVASTEVFGAMSRSTDVAVLFAIVSLAGLGLATANYWGLTQTMMPGAAIGSIAGVQNCASNLSGIAAPIITGWLLHKTGNYEAPMQAIWLVLLLGIGAYLGLVRERYIPKPKLELGTQA